MEKRSLSDVMKWEEISIGATAAGNTSIFVGEIGDEGPLVVITAGTHGDEGPWGAWAIRKLLDRIPEEDLTGRIRVVPVTNPIAMAGNDRGAHLDSLDLNRVFPGKPEGTHSERLAATIVERCLGEDVDVVVDLHGGGSWCVNSFAFSFPGDDDLALAADAPFIVKRPPTEGPPTSLTAYAASQGARITAWEMGGRSGVEEEWAEHIADGLHRVLALAGTVSTPAPPNKVEASAYLEGLGVITPSMGGILLPVLREEAIGTVVDGGTLLGRLVHPATFEELERFEAPYDRTALLLIRNQLMVLNAGDMTYVIGDAS